MSYQRGRDEFIAPSHVRSSKGKVKTMYRLTTQRQVREAFWQGWTPELKAAAGIKRGMKTQNDYPADVRMEWVDFVDMLARDGHISEELAQKVTL